jgi:hypothetical protein
MLPKFAQNRITGGVVLYDLEYVWLGGRPCGSVCFLVLVLSLLFIEDLESTIVRIGRYLVVRVQKRIEFFLCRMLGSPGE